MRILLVTQYFWPEQFIINDLVQHLERQGHEVKVLTGKPNYPEGNVFAGYSKSGVVTEKYAKNIEINRVPLRPRKKGKFNLLKNYCSFVWNGIRYFPKMVEGEQFDVIFVFAMSPITMAIPAILLKRKLKSHLVIWVQDLWPESLSATGYVRNSVILKAVGLLVKSIYYFADTLLVQSHAFVSPVSKYASADKVFYYPNSVDVESLASCKEHDLLPQCLLETLESNFCIVFAGNIGAAQSLETIIDAAKLLKGYNEIKVILVGSGSMLEWVTQQKEKYCLENIELPGRFPVNSMGQFFSRAEGLLVTLKNEEIFGYTIPSKVQSYLAAGKPIIAALNGEGNRVILEAGAGYTCPAENSEALAKCIISLYESTDDERAKLGASGIRYFKENYEMERQSSELIKIIKSRLESQPQKIHKDKR